MTHWRQWIVALVCGLTTVFVFLCDIFNVHFAVLDYVNSSVVGLICIGVILFHHISLQTTERIASGCIALLSAALIVIVFLTVLVPKAAQHPFPLITIGFTLAIYGVLLFMALSDFMIAGLAAFLTRTRGPAWLKEIDYLYLMLAAIGLVGSLNRIEGISGKLTGYDLVGPLIVTTALAVRLLKTRAEIARWNRPPA